DFARPIRYELSRADLNALCRESAAAAAASGTGADIALDLDPAVSAITTDPERLRLALVNMLINARHAVNGHPGPVTLRTRANGDRVRIVVADRGEGIAPGDLVQI